MKHHEILGRVKTVPTSGIILSMHPANERQRYRVTPSLIGWAHAQSDPCGCNHSSLTWNENQTLETYAVVSEFVLFWEKRTLEHKNKNV